MWLIDDEHAVPCCSDDCLSLMVVPKVDAISRVGYLELLPKFRYNVRVSGMSLSSFREVSARLLFLNNVLLVAGHRDRNEEESPTEAAEVSSVILVNMSSRILRITHGRSDVSFCEPARWDGGGSSKRGCWAAGGGALWGKGSASSNAAARGEARDFAPASHWKKQQTAVVRKEAQDDFPLSDGSERSSDSPVLGGG